MIELPTNFAVDLASSTTAQIAQFSPVVLLVTGLILSIVAIGAIIRFVHPR